MIQVSNRSTASQPVLPIIAFSVEPVLNLSFGSIHPPLQYTAGKPGLELNLNA